MTRIDSHWVIDGSSAQKELIKQGYAESNSEWRYGVRYSLMSKEVTE